MSTTTAAAPTPKNPPPSTSHPEPTPSPPFTLTSPPAKDIWRKPPTTNKFDAPLSAPHRGPLRSFHRAALTIALPPPAALATYDQGTLLLAITRPGAALRDAGPAARWVKTGVEMWRGRPWLSTVACEQWADASLVPLGGGPAARVEVERGEGGGGLWVWLCGEGGTRAPLREVCWFFAEEEDGEWEVSVAACAARPLGSEGGEGLAVGFEGLEVEWR
ncbi:uncharacterized protein LTHEOB_9613 [Neofusicoccum parvum]|uniref:Uncharacterized protein LTHEOB_9613 n=1 Tax=Neofusicoccum parvum TaxID=310453 RepID=A0ACB5SJH1_9PEZI|nr:uncharacterized protein LTHEOB_9613 [Neofusicoccum parvum]